jgi:hypothetical protein
MSDMGNNSNSMISQQGVGFCGLLTIVFIVLKLCNVIDWSWWWVLSPIWIPTAIIIAIVILVFIIVIVGAMIKLIYQRKNEV